MFARVPRCVLRQPGFVGLDMSEPKDTIQSLVKDTIELNSMLENDPSNQTSKQGERTVGGWLRQLPVVKTSWRSRI